jgi:hypothetical protein
VPFDGDHLRVQECWGLDETDQIVLRCMCELAGTPYPARTRAEAIEAVLRVGQHFGRQPYGPDDLARMASEDMDVVAGLDPRTRYLLDTAQSRTLTGPQASTEFLLYQLFLAWVLPDGSVRIMLDRVTDQHVEDVEALACALLLRRPPWQDHPLAGAIRRILELERRDRPNPRPEEISHLDVLAEVHSRALVGKAGRPYPPRTRADVIAVAGCWPIAAAIRQLPCWRRRCAPRTEPSSFVGSPDTARLTCPRYSCAPANTDTPT